MNTWPRLTGHPVEKLDLDDTAAAGDGWEPAGLLPDALPAPTVHAPPAAGSLYSHAAYNHLNRFSILIL